MRFKSLLFAAFCLLTVAACHNHDEETDANDPVLTITSPTEGAVLTKPVSLNLKATDESLHEMSVVITRDSDNAELYTKEPEVHDLTEYLLSETWSPADVTAETAVTLTVIVEDHSDHKVTKTVKFTVKP